MRDQPSNLRSSGSMRDQPSNLFSRGSIFYRRPFNLQGMAEKHGFIFLGTKIIIKTLADWLYLDESVLSGYPHLSRAMVRLEEERTKGSWGWCCGSWTRHLFLGPTRRKHNMCGFHYRHKTVYLKYWCFPLCSQGMVRLRNFFLVKYLGGA